jgi:transposase
MVNKRALGLDVSKATVDAALMSNQGTVHIGNYENNPEGYAKLLGWLKRHARGKLHTCMEATGRYGEDLALFLHDHGYPVSVVNPARIKAYGESQLRRNKTDRLDALLIADFCLTQVPDLWTPPAPERRELQELERHLETLQIELQQHRNRLTSGITSETVRRNEEELVAFLERKIAEVRKQMHDHTQKYDGLKADRDLLTSIPGIGEITAFKLLGEMGDWRRFESADQLAAYVGVAPSQHSSGTSVRRRGRISKTGNAHARKGLFMPALTAMKHNPAIYALRQRLEKAKKLPMVIVGAAMHKLLRQCYGVLTSRQPFSRELSMPKAVAAI